MQQAIKTYKQVDKKQENISFSISVLQDTYKNREGKVNAPHRHDFYTILFLEKASGMHNIDFTSYPMADNQVYFISPGQVHQVIEKDISYGYSLTFSSCFLLKNHISLDFIANLNVFKDPNEKALLSLKSSQMQKLKEYAQQMALFYTATNAFKEQAIAANLQLFLIYCTNINDSFYVKHKAYRANEHIVKTFKMMLEKNHLQWRLVLDYANKMHISADHLNKTIKALTGKNAKEHIQLRRIVAAKQMLYFTELSTKEISFLLGYSQSNNFSAFFKKHTNKKPSDFRKEQKNIGF